MKVLTFIFEEVVQQARLSCIRISNNDELEEIAVRHGDVAAGLGNYSD